MQDFEKLGVFYLGKAVDMATDESRDDLVLYDSKASRSGAGFAPNNP